MIPKSYVLLFHIKPHKTEQKHQRLVVARSRGRGWPKWVKVVIRYKLSVISLGDVMFNMVTIVNKTMLYILKLLREILIVLAIKKKKVATMCCNEC